MRDPETPLRAPVDFEDDDLSRAALLLTDILGEMKLHDRKQKPWQPHIVTGAIKDAQTGGLLDLASTLLQKLIQGVRTNATSNHKWMGLKSWEELFTKYKKYGPPWMDAKAMNERPAESRIEVLLFLASSLQNRMLQQEVSGTNQPMNNAPSTSFRISSKAIAYEQVAGKDDVPTLAAHLTSDQRDIIIMCYQGIRADYDKRRMGMKQRLAILASDLETDRPEKDLKRIQEKILKLSFASHQKVVADLTEKDLIQHFTVPHTSDLKLSSSTHESNKLVLPLDNLLIVDRGGRTDDVESRNAMPAWSSSRS